MQLQLIFRLFALISETTFAGITGIIFGGIVLFLAYKSKKVTIEIENYCLTKCLICDDDILKTDEIRYYIGDNLVDKETFEKQTNDKTKRIINYYKCEKCNFCMTIIKLYLYTGNKEKELNKKIQLDFEYSGDY